MAPILGAGLPVASYLEAIGLIGEPQLLLWVAGSAALVLLRGVWCRPDELDGLLLKAAASLVVLLYPGFFIMFLSRVAALEHATFHVLFLFALVFGNDSAAWAFGSLLGRPIGLTISPSKSVAGFAAGLAFSLIVAAAAFALAPALMPGGLAGALLIGAAVGAAAVFGDLLESALKRSAGVKDSGTLMMGRGGLMDSADSLLLAAPVYYLLVGLLGR
jgi:phosphatidate cytidylyltransferase